MIPSKVIKFFDWMINNFKHSLKLLILLPSFSKGFNYKIKRELNTNNSISNYPNKNDLKTFFDNQLSGRGIWKWDHYFEIYDRYLSKFRQSEAVMVEIGIYSGGSLLMWQNYLGHKIKIIGVDIEPACKAYEGGQVHIEIGDQEDISFWSSLTKKYQTIDIVIDDGGHTPDQQLNTFISLFDSMSPGGVYICEDVHGKYHEFAQFCLGMAAKLGEMDFVPNTLTVIPNNLQVQIKSIHIYPFVFVIEKLDTPRKLLFSQKNGTEWQPFYDR